MSTGTTPARLNGFVDTILRPGKHGVPSETDPASRSRSSLEGITMIPGYVA
ncbi:MAG: hypothetical protein ACM3PF_01140 [Bacteroidota bacterium]